MLLHHYSCSFYFLSFFFCFILLMFSLSLVITSPPNVGIEVVLIYWPLIQQLLKITTVLKNNFKANLQSFTTFLNHIIAITINRLCHMPDLWIFFPSRAERLEWKGLQECNLFAILNIKSNAIVLAMGNDQAKVSWLPKEINCFLHPTS